MRVPFGLSGRTLILGSGLGILLIVLGNLQYRWIDRVSEVERGRRQNQLREDTARFTADFDSELARLHFFFQRGLFQSSDAAAWITVAYQRWKEDQVYGDLLKEVWRIRLEKVDQGRGTPGPGSLQLGEVQRFDASSSSFQRNDWPRYLTPIRERLGALLQGLPVPPERGYLALDGDVPAILIPMLLPEDRRWPVDLSQITLFVLVLDEEYIQSVFFPELAMRHFASGSVNEFRLWVKDRDSSTVRFEWPESDGQLPPVRPDIRQPIFVLQAQREAGGPGRGLGRGGGGPGRGRRMRGPGPAPAAELRGPPPEGEWELVAVHRAGSLEAAVLQVKRRNLFLGTGILLILAASIIITLVSAQRARDLARRQMDFVASVSHELRTPLTAIRSAAQNLEDGVVTEAPRISEYGRIIRTAETRLNAMVMQVLDFARSQSTGPTELLGAVALSPLVDHVIEELRPSVLQGAARITVDLPADLPPVSAGRNGLRRVLENLIQNSVKYSGGQVEIRVSAEAKGRQVRIAVRDNGPGIDKNDLAYIFEPFYRGRNVQTTQIQGSGLGLSLVKRIIESFGGSVRVESEPGQGTVFWITLKRADGAEP